MVSKPASESSRPFVWPGIVALCVILTASTAQAQTFQVSPGPSTIQAAMAQASDGGTLGSGQLPQVRVRWLQDLGSGQQGSCGFRVIRQGVPKSFGVPPQLTEGDQGTWNEVPPPRRWNACAICDPVRNRLLVFGGTNGLDQNEVLVLPLASPGGWTRLEAGGFVPSARSGASAIYDPVRDRMLVFGGSVEGAPRNGTWALALGSNPKWSLLRTTTPPPPREGQAAVYDPVRDRLVIIGGRTRGTLLNDVWALSLGDTSIWTQLSPTGDPPAGRTEFAAIYDAVGDRIVLCGGLVETVPQQLVASNDAWQLSLGASPAWSKLEPSGTPPPPLAGHTATYDPRDDRMILYGGNGSASAWALSLNPAPAWTQLEAAGVAPVPRSGHVAVLDSLLDRIVFFGGTYAATDPVDVEALLLRPNPTWVRLGHGELPEGRFGQATVYDPRRERMIIFGGVHIVLATDEIDYLNDSWMLSLDGPLAWSRLTPSGSLPEPRMNPTAVYDSRRDRVVTFGGWVYQDDYFNDVWVLNPGQTPEWIRMYPAGDPPPGRRGHSAIYDPVRDRMLVYGGSTQAGFVNDLWALNFTGQPRWQRLTPLEEPFQVRAFHSAVYDPIRDRMIVFGGSGGRSSLDDVWELSLAGIPRWTRLLPNHFGPSLAAHTAVFDSRRQRMLIYGGEEFDGDAGALYVGTWALDLGRKPSWSILQSVGQPATWRTQHSAVYDPIRDRMVLFGGSEFIDGLNDSWSLDFDSSNRQLAWVTSAQGEPRRARVVWYAAMGSETAATVYRSEDEVTWAPAAHVVPDDRARIEYDDLSVREGTRMYYRLGFAEGDSEVYAGEVGVAIPAVPGLQLLASWPNPARSSEVSIPFALPGSGAARLELVEVSGRRIWGQEVGRLGEGLHIVRPGIQLRPGVYVARLTRGDQAVTSKIVVLH